MQDKNKLLMIFVEPTPYIARLIVILDQIWCGQLDVIFLKKSFTQMWDVALEKHHVTISNKFIDIIKILYNALYKEGYHAIFLAGWSHPISLSIMLLSKLVGIPIIVDSDTALSHFTPFWKRIIKRIVYPGLFKLPTVFLPAGKRQAAYLQHYNVPVEKIVLEQMTVDVVAIRQYIQQLPDSAHAEMRKQWLFSETDFVFLFVGRLIERKGILELLKAFSKIQDTRAKLLIVGDGPLRDLVETAANLNQNIRYAGWLQAEQVIDMYFVADILLLPAYWEPWGLVVNEALAVGRPVIVSDQVGCIDDLVISGKTGLIVQCQAIDDLYLSMYYILNHPTHYVAMCHAASQHIASWTLENEAKNICAACNTAIKSVLVAE